MKLTKVRKVHKCLRCGKVINPGDMAYQWTPFRGPTRYWCKDHAPKREEMTDSEYLQSLYSILDEEKEFTTLEEAEEFVTNLISSLAELLDAQQDKLDNMPEGLQQGSTGEMIQERIDQLESAISDLENIEYDEVENDYVREEYESEEVNGGTKEDFEEDQNDQEEERLEEMVTERLEAIESEIDEALGQADC